MISRLVTVFSEDLHFELDKAKFVLLVVLHPAVVGAALHVNQLAGRPGEFVYMFFYIFVFRHLFVFHMSQLAGLPGVDLDRHQGRMVPNANVCLVHLALKEAFKRTKD